MDVLAAVTGWPEGTAKTLIRRGLVRLKSLMVINDSKGGDPA